MSGGGKGKGAWNLHVERKNTMQIEENPSSTSSSLDESKEENLRLLELLYEVDVDASIDADAAEIIQHLTNEFIDKVTLQAVKIAKHRKSSEVEYKDLQFVLENVWGMRLPGMFKNHLVNLDNSDGVAVVNSSNTGAMEQEYEKRGVDLSDSKGVKRRIENKNLGPGKQKKGRSKGEYIKVMPSTDEGKAK